MLEMLAYAVLLGALGVLLVAAAGALREGLKQRGRLRGVVVNVAVILVALLGLVALLI